MWYASYVLKPESIIGKPLVVYIDGARRQIGVITRAVIKDGSFYVAADINLEGEDADEAA